MLPDGGTGMADVITFSDHRLHRVVEPGRETARPEGKVIAMRHVDLASVLETVRVLRSSDWAMALDPFNTSDPQDPGRRAV